MSLLWSATNGTITAAQGTCPDGTSNAISFADNSTNGSHKLTFNPGTNQGAGTYTASVQIKPAAVNGLGFIRLANGASAEQTTFDIINGTVALSNSFFGGYSTSNTDMHIYPAANGFYTLSHSVVDSTGESLFQIYVGDSYSDIQGSYVGSGRAVIICNPMLAFVKDSRPYVVNSAGSGTATRKAELVSVANPLVGGTMVLAATVTPDNYRYDNWIERGLIGGGFDAGNDNDSYRWFVSDGGQMTFVLTDHAGAQDTWVSNTVIWPGRRHLRLVDNAGTVTMYQDGALDGGLIQLATTHSGSNGDGFVTTQPTTLFIGSEGSQYANQFGGVMQDLCADPTTTGCAYQFTKHHTAPLYTAKSLLALGDSLTQNILANSTYWPQMLANDVPTWNVINAGTPSYVVGQITQKLGDGGWFSSPRQFTTIENGINDAIAASYTDAEWERWQKQLWDIVSASGSNVVVLRESPFRFSASWNSTIQGHYSTYQDWVLTEAALYGYPLKDFYGNDGGLIDGGAAGASSLLCQFDYDTDGTAVKCPDGSGGGTSIPNWVHTNDAGQGTMESNIRGLLGL